MKAGSFSYKEQALFFRYCSFSTAYLSSLAIYHLPLTLSNTTQSQKIFNGPQLLKKGNPKVTQNSLQQ